MKKLEQQDIEKVMYYMEVAAKYYGTTYKEIKDLPENNIFKLSVFKLGELIQKECYKAEDDMWDYGRENENNTWIDKVIDWLYSLKLNFNKPNIKVSKISENSSVKINIK